MSNPFYAIVLAGGSGTRFWPLSRNQTPKQLLRLFDAKTLLEETVERLNGLVPTENILLLTNEEQEAAVRKLLPQLPVDNIVSEPARRDTGPAIALGVGLLAARNQAATVAVLPADHLIRDKAAFQADLVEAARAAERGGDLVTIGITPTWGFPGYGYIERGKSVSGLQALPLFEVSRFREKPNPELAESFVRSGNFYWNAGIFVWTVNAIVTAFTRHAPALGEFVSTIRRGHKLNPSLWRSKFEQLPKISIDYAVMEKANRVLVLPATFDWDDVGGWTAVAKYLEHLPQNNVANTALTAQESTNNIVFSEDRLHVALLGVNDLVVVQTKDAILVCSRHEVENVKKLVANLPVELQ